MCSTLVHQLIDGVHVAIVTVVKVIHKTETDCSPVHAYPDIFLNIFLRNLSCPFIFRFFTFKVKTFYKHCMNTDFTLYFAVGFHGHCTHSAVSKSGYFASERCQQCEQSRKEILVWNCEMCTVTMEIMVSQKNLIHQWIGPITWCCWASFTSRSTFTETTVTDSGKTHGILLLT